MNLTLVVLALACLLTAACAQAPDGYKLVWSDEFDYDGLPDPEKWGYEEGFVRNNEAQYYTVKRLENCRVEGGNLVIEGRKERFENPKYDPNADDKAPKNKRVQYADYTAASINTSGIASWCYGRIEVRAKLPHGKGTWPAIWMLGDTRGKIGWPGCGEIDIMEYVGHTPNKVHATLHWKRSGKHASKGSAITVEQPWDDFHVYAVEWDAEQMRFFFDDQVYHTWNVADGADGEYNPFHHPHYLLLNLALGGSWGREIDDSIFPQQYLVDYVRVYQKD